ncbi:hypothetical protein FACS1894163_01760 [Spirochaetia bacterium]|nr:hypothetical protein FACS1894163_01760 [Spirochaetia bacterium]
MPVGPVRITLRLPGFSPAKVSATEDSAVPKFSFTDGVCSLEPYPHSSIEKCSSNTKIEDFEHGIFAEADAFLENGDSVMVVEIKTKLKTEPPTGGTTRTTRTKMMKIRKRRGA